MRFAVIAAAFAVGAIAVPHQHQKRAIETDTDVVVVYATDVVTVTAGAPTSSVAAAPETTAATSSSAAHYAHHWRPTWSWSSAESSTVESSSAEPTSTYVAPSYSAEPTSTYVAPTTSTEASSTYVAPTTSSTPSSTYVAPTTSSTPSSTYVAPSSTEASSTSAVATSVPTSYEQITVYHHNIHRSNHSAPDIEWDDGLASTAASIASNCVYAHNVTAAGGGYGQNIAAGVQANNISAIITDLFYNGEVGWYDGLYGQAQPDMTNFEHWGHFSQIVWKATTKVGCATQDCSANGLANVGSLVAPYFTVCNYESPGNYANEYGDNVGSPLNNPTAQWNTGLSS